MFSCEKKELSLPSGLGYQMCFVLLIVWDSWPHSLLLVIQHTHQLPLKCLFGRCFVPRGHAWAPGPTQPSRHQPSRQVPEEQGDGKALIVLVSPSESSLWALKAEPTCSVMSPGWRWRLGTTTDCGPGHQLTDSLHPQQRTDRVGRARAREGC